MYRVLIVEDEPEAEARLCKVLERYGAEHGEQFQVAWMRTAFELVVDQTADFDLVFLDIDLPGINGMEAALALREHDQTTPIIFVTNLAQYAVRGYEAEALDFIVKPVEYGSFAMRMDRALLVMRRAPGRSLTVHSKDGLRIFKAADLVCVEVRGNNLTFHLASGEDVHARGSLTKLEPELGGSPFLRVSASCIVNMGHIRGVRGAEISLTGGQVAWLSRAYKRRCLDEIARYLGGDA